MRKEIFAIFDSETAYTSRLLDFVYKKYGDFFDIQAFTSVNKFCEFVAENNVELLLIAAQEMSDTIEKIQKIQIGKIILLSEGDIIPELAKYQTVYKYQAGASMLAEVMEHYALKAVETPPLLLKQKMRIFGVYSPISRVLKTSFALTLGQILAKNSATLYLNLESFSGFETLTNQMFSSDFADVMYFQRRGVGNLIYKVQGLVQNLGQLDYLPPFFSPEDLISIRAEEWLELLQTLEEQSIYENIILDMGEGFDGLFKLLEKCGMIYMPIRDDVLSQAKLQQYKRLLEVKELTEIMEKTRQIKLPFHSSFGSGEQYLEQLLWGELGDYVRELLCEE